MGLRATAGDARRVLISPFDGTARLRPPLLVHASHHKAGTVWFENVLQAVSRNYHLHFREISREPIPPGTGVAFYTHASAAHWESIATRPSRVSHMVRDPRDMVVSAYFYHRRSNEEWLHWPRPELGGLTYQEHLLALPQKEGLAEEIRRCARDQVPDLMGWPYGRPGVLELRYEDAMADEEAVFRRLFAHYGFRTDAIEQSVATALSFSLSRGGGGSSHARSGRPGEWRTVFDDDHVALFKELMGQTVLELGYEASPAWSR